MTIFQEDAELLRAFRAGETAALERVYWWYVDAVANIVRHGTVIGGASARAWGSEHSDLVQETFARAFSERARLAYDGLRAYRPYLLTICRNLLVDHARRKGRQLELDENIERLAESTPNDDDDWAEPEVVATVRRYIQELDPELLDVYRQRYVAGVSQAACANALGLSRQTVRTLEKRLREGLRRALKTIS